VDLQACVNREQFISMSLMKAFNSSSADPPFPIASPHVFLNFLLLHQNISLNIFLYLSMKTGRVGGGFKHLCSRFHAPAIRLQIILGVKIKHPTSLPMGTGLPASAPPPLANTLFFIKYLKNPYIFIFFHSNKKQKLY